MTASRWPRAVLAMGGCAAGMGGACNKAEQPGSVIAILQHCEILRVRLEEAAGCSQAVLAY